MAKLRARYLVKKLGKQPVTYMKCWMDEKTNSLQQEQVTEDRDCYMVVFPQGHSIRVTSAEQLKELGYDRKPRTVDMETGDVVDAGGALYDFDNMNVNNDDDIIIEEKPARSKTAKETV